MKLFMYSVFDSIANAYGTPFFVPSDGLARRSFADLLSDPRSTIYLNPQDFTLYKIGSFMDDNATVESIQPPVLICRALDFQKTNGD